MVIKASRRIDKLKKIKPKVIIERNLIFLNITRLYMVKNNLQNKIRIRLKFHNLALGL